MSNAAPSIANGITFCTGSLGAGTHNDVPALAARFAKHIHFAHLRNVAKEPDGSFMEADHLGGDTDTIGAMATAICGALHGVGAIDLALKQELDAVNQLDFTRYASGLMRLREQREAL